MADLPVPLAEPAVRSARPGQLPSHPQHALARRQVTGFGGVLSVGDFLAVLDKAADPGQPGGGPRRGA